MRPNSCSTVRHNSEQGKQPSYSAYSWPDLYLCRRHILRSLWWRDTDSERELWTQESWPFPRWLRIRSRLDWTSNQQRYWTRRCLAGYTKRFAPHRGWFDRLEWECHHCSRLMPSLSSRGRPADLPSLRIWLLLPMTSFTSFPNSFDGQLVTRPVIKYLRMV